MTDPWIFATVGLMAPLVAAVVAAGRGSPSMRLAALQLASCLAALVMVVCSFAFDQPSTIDLALTLAILSLPGALIFGLFLERWV